MKILTGRVTLLSHALDKLTLSETKLRYLIANAVKYSSVEMAIDVNCGMIGFYLNAEIIHRHDGRIQAESEFGKGSV
ncbi:hypothetical protein ACSBL2_08550 [Pedobacter sp. AW31-3R]|uniref:hypothetical protein n=1 Tax=Pedobacter sp. AW31-3R TaxID=3445781 RepID=UPI003FA1032E